MNVQDVTHCIYHANCYDGFGSALAVWQRNPKAQFIPAKYGDKVPEIPPGSRVVICDFSYPRDLILTMKAVYDVLVIDHHKTAEADLQGLDFAIFDMNHSGAVLTWLWANPGEPIAPPLFLYLEDRDLWRYKMDHSREVSAWIQSYPYDFDVFNAFTQPGGMQDAITEGKAILRAKSQMVNQVADGAVMRRLGGHDGVPVVNATVYYSEVGEELCRRFPEAPFAAYYMDRADGKRQWGLRGRKGGVDCSAVAKGFGGGGHADAAGFVTEVPDPLGAVAQNEELDRVRVQLAGCLIAAEGTLGGKPAQQGDFGWSPAYNAIVELRAKYEDMKGAADRFSGRAT